MHGRVEKRNIPCWVITKDSSSQSVLLHNAKPLSNTAKTDISIQDIVSALNRDYGNTPVIDESGNGNLELFGLSREQYTDIPALKKKFKEYGLKIILENRTIDMLVISEK